jgi:hypothetical protein
MTCHRDDWRQYNRWHLQVVARVTKEDRLVWQCGRVIQAREVIVVRYRARQSSGDTIVDHQRGVETSTRRLSYTPELWQCKPGAQHDQVKSRKVVSVLSKRSVIMKS